MTMDGDGESLHCEFLSRTTRYKELLNTFLRISEPHITEDILYELKEIYNEEIASLREKDRIEDLRGLLRILEKRDALRYDEIEPLAVIANEYVKDEPLKRTINNYAATIREEEPLGRINHYKFGEPPRNRSAVRQNGSHTVTIYAPETTLPVVPYTANFTGASSTRASGSEERVFHSVSDNLGRHWRDVARFLGVKESEIDTIEQKSYLGTKEKAYEALCIFKSRCDRCNWKLKLQRALEKARRKDLSEMVSEIWFSDN